MVTLKAKIDEKGNVTLLEPVAISSPRNALVMVLEESVMFNDDLDDDNLTEAELEAEDRMWEEMMERHADKFAALKAQAKAEVAAGKTIDAFDENGEFVL